MAKYFLNLFQMKHSLRTAAVLFTLLTLVLTSCKKEDTIPNVAVDFYVHLSDPQFVNLQVVGGWVYVTGGSKGIIIYRKSQSEFMAFDRHCPYKPSDGCTVTVDSSNLLCEDASCCHSKFLITDGSVSSGPASHPLKRYQTSFDGTDLVHVFN